MNWEEFLEETKIRDYEVEIIDQPREGDHYKKGAIGGFKHGIFGGGHSKFKGGVSMSFDSSKMHWIKRPKILVVYNIFEYGKGEHTEWIDVDNLIFRKKQDEK